MNPILLNIVTLALQTLKSKSVQDEILDFIEDRIENSETLVDDKTLLPMIKAYRTAFNVPDGDD